MRVHLALMNIPVNILLESIYFVLREADFMLSKIVKQKSTLAAGSSSACNLTAHSQCAFLALIYELRWVLWSLLELTLWNSRLNKLHRIVNRLHDWIPRQEKCQDLFAVFLGSYPSYSVYLHRVWPHKQTLLETVVWSHFTKCVLALFWHFLECGSGACPLMSHHLVVIGNIKLSGCVWTLLDDYDGIWEWKMTHFGVLFGAQGNKSELCSQHTEWTIGEPSLDTLWINQ